MSGATSAVALGVLAAGTAYSAYNQKQSLDDQRSAQKKQEKAAKLQADQAAQEFNRANRKAPDIGSLLAGNAAGGGSTMLTGPAGVNAGSLSLGKNTLLGQ